MNNRDILRPSERAQLDQLNLQGERETQKQPAFLRCAKINKQTNKKDSTLEYERTELLIQELLFELGLLSPTYGQLFSCPMYFRELS